MAKARKNVRKICFWAVIVLVLIVQIYPLVWVMMSSLKRRKNFGQEAFLHCRTA